MVASEAITVGDTTVTLPGIGSYLALAIANQQFGAVAWAVAAMALLILLYDQLLFRPIVVWADKFRVELTAGRQIPRSWVYDLICRTRLLKRLVAPLTRLWQRVLILRWTKRNRVTVLPVSPGWVACVEIDYGGWFCLLWLPLASTLCSIAYGRHWT